MKKYFYVYVLLFGLGKIMLSSAMEASSLDFIVLRTIEGKQLELDRRLVLQSGYIRNMLEFVPYQEEDWDRNIDLSSPLLLINGVTLNKRLLKQAFTCLGDTRNIEKLSEDELMETFVVADFLNFPRTVLRKLLFSKKSFDDDDRIEFSRVMNSIRNLYDDRFFENIDIIQTFGDREFMVDLSNKSLDNLVGIDLLVDKFNCNKYPIQLLDVSNNNLENFDLGHIITLFPFLKKVSAKNNKIKEVVFPKKMLNDFELDLENNEIQELPLRSIGEDALINVKGNPVTPKFIKASNRTLLLPFSKRFRLRAIQFMKASLLTAGFGVMLLYIYVLYNSDAVVLMLLWGGLGIAVPIIAILGKARHDIKNPQYHPGKIIFDKK